MLVPPVLGVCTMATRQLPGVALGVASHARHRRGVDEHAECVGQTQSDASGWSAIIAIMGRLIYHQSVFTARISAARRHTITMLSFPNVVPSRSLPASLHVLLDYEHRSSLAPLICGNKARKLASLLDDSASGRLSRLRSHGGAQSNAMLAIARLCAARGAEFEYHTRPLPRFLRNQPTGNLARALSLGMTLIEHKTAANYAAACARLREDEESFVPQGAAYSGAELGCSQLAAEIADWWHLQQQQQQRPPPTASPSLSVIVPAGTGTTALFLARHSPPDVRVYAVPAVGGEAALVAQMSELDQASGGAGILPRVLPPPSELAVPFGEPRAAVLDTWRRAASEHGVMLDLLYGAIAWGALTARGSARPTLYVNAGGHEGLGTSLRRYQRAGLLRAGETAEGALAEALSASGAELSEDPFDW